MIDKNRMRKHFNQHADEYEQFAVIQKEMADQLLSKLFGFFDMTGQQPRRVLEIGCGTGYLTQQLIEHVPGLQLTALDLSEKMLLQAKRKCGEAADRVQWVLADVERWAQRQASDVEVGKQATDNYDLIVSNATFQWLNTPQETLRYLAKLLNRKGCLAYSTFGENTFYELHTSFALAEQALSLPLSRHGQPFPKMKAWQDMLAECQLEQCSCKRENRRFYYTSVREFLYQVKRVGAGNAQTQPVTALGGRRLFEEMYRAYEHRFGTPHGMPATYEVEYYVYQRRHNGSCRR